MLPSYQLDCWNTHLPLDDTQETAACSSHPPHRGHLKFWITGHAVVPSMVCNWVLDLCWLWNWKREESGLHQLQLSSKIPTWGVYHDLTRLFSLLFGSCDLIVSHEPSSSEQTWYSVPICQGDASAFYDDGNLPRVCTGAAWTTSSAIHLQILRNGTSIWIGEHRAADSAVASLNVNSSTPKETRLGLLAGRMLGFRLRLANVIDLNIYNLHGCNCLHLPTFIISK